MYKSKPILFKPEMLKAILEGRKQITRRIAKTQHNPYGKGDGLLWVKERTWWEHGKDFTNVAYYDGTLKSLKTKEVWKIPDWKPDNKDIWKSRSSMFMPKNVARLWLRIEQVRKERLQDISEADAIKEGILFYKDPTKTKRFRDYLANGKEYGHPDHDYATFSTAKESFASLWESINGKGSWKQNPFVWRIAFEPILCYC